MASTSTIHSEQDSERRGGCLTSAAASSGGGVFLLVDSTRGCLEATPSTAPRSTCSSIPATRPLSLVRTSSAPVDHMDSEHPRRASPASLEQRKLESSLCRDRRDVAALSTPDCESLLSTYPPGCRVLPPRDPSCWACISRDRHPPR